MFPKMKIQNFPKNKKSNNLQYNHNWFKDNRSAQEKNLIGHFHMSLTNQRSRNQEKFPADTQSPRLRVVWLKARDKESANRDVMQNMACFIRVYI